MPRNPNAAVLSVRMSPELREGLRAAAAASGCSVNAYCVQVLAASAGHRTRFRGSAESGPTEAEQRDDVRALDRNRRGVPQIWREKDRHIAARNLFIERLQRDGFNISQVMRAVEYVDPTCPWHYVEWAELAGPLWPDGYERRQFSPGVLARGPAIRTSARRRVTPSASMRLTIGSTYLRVVWSKSRMSATVSSPRSRT